MLKELIARAMQGHRTMSFPNERVTLTDRYQGKPSFDNKKCAEGCSACSKACPTTAISRNCSRLKLDLGRCLFCRSCVEACPEKAIAFSHDYRMAVRERNDLVVSSDQVLVLANSLEGRIKGMFGRSLRLRQVSAGGCNACEADTNVLGTVVFDLARFGIQFVASPRHADGILVTGPVSKNMELALKKTYDGVAAPKLVIAVGACAISGGPYAEHQEVLNGVSGILPVDLFIPGCPPHPLTILDGMLRLLGQIESGKSRSGKAA